MNPYTSPSIHFSYIKKCSAYVSDNVFLLVPSHQHAAQTRNSESDVSFHFTHYKSDARLSAQATVSHLGLTDAKTKSHSATAAKTKLSNFDFIR